MGRLTSAAGLALFLRLVAVSAQPLAVDYVFGQAEAFVDGRWSRLSAGTAVDARATLRLAPDAVVEIIAGDSRVAIAAPGLYLLNDLISRRAVAGSGLAAFLRSALRTLVSPAGKTEAPPGGARSGVDPEPPAWMEDDERALADAVDLLREGRTAEARKLLLEARSRDLDTAPLDFLIAWSEALEGRTGVALSILRKLDLASPMRYGGEALVLRAELALEAGAPAEALAAARAGAAVRAQECLLIEGLALRDLGREAESRGVLERAVKAGPDTEAGRAAARALAP
jgi:hypothetical protein